MWDIRPHITQNDITRIKELSSPGRMIQIPFPPTMDHRTIVLLGVLALAATTVRHNFFIYKNTSLMRSAQRILVFTCGRRPAGLLATLVVVVVVVGGGGITFIHGHRESPCMVLKN